MSLLFCCIHSTLSSAQLVNQNKTNGQTFCEKVKLTKIFNWLQRRFNKINHKNRCQINSPVFFSMWISAEEFWRHRWKIYHRTYVQWLWPCLRFFACLPSHLAPSWFNNTVGTVKIVKLPIWPKLFWDCPKHFGSVKTILEIVRKAMLNVISTTKWFLETFW